jgi:hypothetical protein
MEYQDPLIPIVRTRYSTASLSCLLSEIIFQESIIPYANQNFGGNYSSGTTAIVGGQSQVRPVAPQAPVAILLCFMSGLTLALAESRDRHKRTSAGGSRPFPDPDRCGTRSGSSP